ncbi:MAG: hypothetical protein VB861_07710 [Planctomycetaceae bacterium]
MNTAATTAATTAAPAAAKAATRSKLQAIPGAETQVERTVIAVWPSIASTGVGRMIGSLIQSAPEIRLPVLNVNLALAPTLLLGPIAAAVYLWVKVIGQRYTVTNRRVLIQGSLTRKLNEQVSLEQIAEVAVAPYRDGQEFYHSADVVLLDQAGKELMRLEAVMRPGVFRQNILETRDARVKVQDALDTIQARHDG